jgi:hypothetical protein
VISPKAIALALTLTFGLAGCSVADLATSAADAAACRALESTIEAAALAVDEGLVDSGVIAHLDSLIGEQVRSVLSSGLAKDLGDFAAAVGESEPGQSTKDKVAQLSQSIQTRCAAVGVNFTN